MGSASPSAQVTWVPASLGIMKLMCSESAQDATRTPTWGVLVSGRAKSPYITGRRPSRRTFARVVPSKGDIYVFAKKTHFHFLAWRTGSHSSNQLVISVMRYRLNSFCFMGRTFSSKMDGVFLPWTHGFRPSPGRADMCFEQDLLCLIHFRGVSPLLSFLHLRRCPGKKNYLQF